MRIAPKPRFTLLGRSWQLLGGSWAAPAASWGALGPLLRPPGALLGSILPFRGPPLGASWAPLGPPGGPPSRPGAPRSPKSTKNQQKHEKYRILRGSSWEHRVFARFGYIFDPENVAKSSENAGLPAETSYFTRVRGCMFTLFSSPGKLKHTCFTCVQLFLR